MPTAFSSLPNEILRHVAQLAGNDVQNLRAANKSINAAVDSVMWETYPIIVHLNKNNLWSSMAMLEELSRGPVDKLKFWRLDIKSSDPSAKYHPRGLSQWAYRQRAEHSEAADMEATMETRRSLPEVLSKALSALTGLRSIKWDITQLDWDCTAYEPALERLGRLPHLTDVQITSFGVDTSTLPLHHLKHGSLRRLAIQQWDGQLSDFKQLISSLTTVFIQNPRLIHLELDMLNYGTHLLLFEDLFENIPPNTLQLRSLLLSGWSVHVSPRVRPHLQSLTSIQLLSWNSDSVAFWKYFIDSSPGARLPFVRISCCELYEELLDLLQWRSMPRLEILEFEVAGADTDERSDHFAQRFYSNIFSRYQSTLTELSLVPSYTGDWTIGFRNLDVFDECKQLIKLSVGLDPSEILPGGKEKDIVASFITRVTRLPSLSTISLHQVPSKYHRDALCGLDQLIESEMIFERTQDSVEKTETLAVFHLVHGRFRIVIPSRAVFADRSTVEFIPELDNGTSGIVRFRRRP